MVRKCPAPHQWPQATLLAVPFLGLTKMHELSGKAVYAFTRPVQSEIVIPIWFEEVIFPMVNASRVAAGLQYGIPVGLQPASPTQPSLQVVGTTHSHGRSGPLLVHESPPQLAAASSAMPMPALTAVAKQIVTLRLSILASPFQCALLRS